VADVAGHAARQLSARGGGRAILVDADAHGKVLTQRFAATMEQGLAEALLDGIPPSRHVITTAVPYLDFLPWGRGRISRRATTPVLVRGMVAEWKRCYRYTIVAGGVELASPVGLFSRYCDATYLVVQLGQAGPESTRAAADTLMAAGARVLGCVATGVRRDKELASGSAGTEWSPLPRGAAA
jgi:Mrp family chromosome partitioning ATPase